MTLPRSAFAVGIAIGLMLCAAPAQARALLTACIDQSSPSAKMDERVVQAAALSQGYGLRIERFDGQGLGDEAYSSDNFGKLADGLCQLILGFPVDPQAPLLPGGVLATKPYAQTGFVLVTRNSQPSGALAGLPDGAIVGVIFQTAPSLYFQDHPGLQPSVYPRESELIAAMVSGKLAAAMVWQPSLARHAEDNRQPRKLFVQLLNEAHARWNLVALYGSRSAAAAKVFEQGVLQLNETRRLAQLVEPYANVVETSPDHRDAAPTPTPVNGGRHDAGRLIKVADKTRITSSKRPALYTVEQAKAGLMSYAMNCSYCHGAGLEGRTGPSLKGEKFASIKTNFVVGDIFFVLSMQMPAGNPGTLPKEEYAALMAYLLQQNGYPAGAGKLDYDEALKSEVPLIYSGH